MRRLKLFSLLMLLLVGLNQVWATDATFTFSSYGWSNESSHTTVTSSPITLTANGGGNNGKYYTSDNTWRMYSGGSVSITAASGYTITAVSSNPSQTFTVSNGSASLSLSATVKFKSITVTYSSSGGQGGGDSENLFEFDGGKSDIASTDGISHSGLGSDYGSSPKLKFDGTGDYVIVQVSSAPGQLSYDIVGNSFSGGTFSVLASADGSNYSTTIATYTSLESKKNEEYDLASSIRYIKFIYTSKSSGNVALGNIVVTAASGGGGGGSGKTDPSSAQLSWSAASATVTMGANNNTFPTLTKTIDGSVSYSSTNTNVATINPSTGAITLVKGGTTTIKASYAGNATYNAKDVTYTLTVNKPTIANGMVDKLYIATFGVTGTGSYSAFTAKAASNSGHSPAVYAGTVARNGNSTTYNIQLNSGQTSNKLREIATSTSGGYAKRVEVTWATQSTNTASRKLTVYGQNSAYTGSETASSGTEIGDIEYVANAVSEYLDITTNYKFIQIVASNAIYMDEIDITWVPALYTLTYEAEGGSVTPTSQTQASSGASITTPTPTRTGYSCTGWYTAATGGSKRCNAGAAYTPTDDETLHAQWTANTINLTLDKNNSDAGSVDGSGSIKYDATSKTTLTAASRTGYTVEGYYSENTCAAANKVLTNAGAVVNSTVSGYTTSGKWSRTTTPTTLYAKWTANTNTAYAVKHYKQQLDGSYSATPDDTDNETGTTGASVTPAVKSYTGFSAPNTQTTAILADGSLVVSYQYTRNSYALSWVTDGDALTGGYTSGDTKFGATITAPNTPTKTGYTFAGWDSDVAATMPASATTYTATWTANTNTAYKVKHYKQQLDGTYSATPDETDNLVGTTGADVTPAVEDYEGFTAPATQTTAILADGSLVITYNYTRNSYNLAWDANGGNELTGDYTAAGSIKYGATITAPNTPTKSGWSFNGWNPAFTGTMPAGNTTYVAQWTATTHTITYNGNGSDGGSTPVDGTAHDHGSTVKTLNNTFTKTNYDWDSWNTQPDGQGASYDQNDDITVNDDITLYAIWNCIREVNVTKGTPSHGSFTLDQEGYLQTCGEDGVVVTVTPSPATGYQFSEVTATSGSVNNTTVTFAQYASGSSTINVTFAAKHITVTWNVNGGDDLAQGTSEYIYDGSTVSLPTPTRTGYDFDGWYTEAEGGDPIDNVGGANKPSADVEYYAHWTVKSYAVTWKISGTAWTTDGQSSVNHGSHVTTLPTAPDPGDYCGDKFMGWTDAENGEFVYGTSNLYKTASEFPNATGAQIFYAVFADYAN